MVVMIEKFKKHHCGWNGCTFETDDDEEFQRHQQQHMSDRRNYLDSLIGLVHELSEDQFVKLVTAVQNENEIYEFNDLWIKIARLINDSDAPLEFIKKSAMILSHLWKIHHDREDVRFSICVEALKQ